METFAELLTESENYAVVQLPNRQFPGVVFQGDSLSSFGERLIGLRRLLAAGQVEDADFEISTLIDDVRAILNKYERVLKTREIALPYTRPPGI